MIAITSLFNLLVTHNVRVILTRIFFAFEACDWYHNNMLIANRCRLYPSPEQETLMCKTIGSSRYVYNLFLDTWNTTYKYTGEGMTYSTCAASLTELKKVLPWLKEVDSTALQSALRSLSNAFSAFF